MSQPAAEAFEDGLDLQIGLLEAFVPKVEERWASYPFPNLKVTDAQEMRTFRTVILENPYLRLTFLPGMGGRLISLFDKRTQTEILRRHPMIEPQAGGRRGAFVREGLQVVLTGEERLNALGNVATQLEHAPDEESDAVLWIAETVTGTGLSFHLRVSLPPDRAEVHLECRVLNREFKPQRYDGGLRIYLGDGHFDGTTFYSPDRKAGLAILPDRVLFDGTDFQGGFLELHRFGREAELAPRQVDTWSLTLLPISGLSECLGASNAAAVNWDSQSLSIQVAEQRLGHKLFLLTQDGQTLEAPVDLYPEHLLEIPIEGLGPVECVLRDPGKIEVLRVTKSPERNLVSSEPNVQIYRSSLSLASNRGDLVRATFNIAERHLGHTLLGLKDLQEKEFAKAGDAFEQALAYNADDPLLWWSKAIAGRLAELDNQAELLNAHYLAPLEPALRAESFLNQPVSLDPEPNRLLTPLEENVEEFIEVACLLIEAGLFDQASRWIDEALRHRDLPMLRYLMAYCLLCATRLATEALDQVRIAAQSPIAPPFPYRTVEREAINTLLAAFPDDRSLSILAELMKVHLPLAVRETLV